MKYPIFLSTRYFTILTQRLAALSMSNKSPLPAMFAYMATGIAAIPRNFADFPLGFVLGAIDGQAQNVVRASITSIVYSTRLIIS